MFSDLWLTEVGAGPALLAPLLTFVGLGLVYLHWRRRSGSAAVLWVGWGSVMLATPLWVLQVGPEFGVIYQLITISACAWLLTLSNLEPKTHTEAPQRPPQPYSVPWRALGARTINGIVLSSLASALLTLAVCGLLPMDAANQMVIAALLFPCLWAGLASWVCASDRFWRHAGLLTLISLFSVAIVMGVQ
ncbi:hypothetical protein [Ferrimonas sp. SCSIO 43195]|uniref:hypothetical protein n=1 Tax=Ferrimonas sp. SCSIO 43195 TaxID=2822844 RepID=UPI00207537ED|nr:hypothetical protein [Ferrimonas sp. SCSIO 43195]USD38692.1 hypothetical protein J8Z22_06205 [Ferrimonas sp. SCSIO 43195]